MVTRLIVVGLFFACTAPLSAQWKPAGNNLKTVWGEHLDPYKVWAEYPRPIMARSEWQNLNGLWNYAITSKDTAAPTKPDGQILVPFCPESSLSGVQKPVEENQTLWYEREFTVPPAWAGRQIRLNFGAVDWQAEVSINGTKVGEHQGGYAPFSFDITAQLTGTGRQRLLVKVWDPTNASYHPVGKQRLHPSLIWYTPVSGIWQTVWVEPVAIAHIASVVAQPDIDHGTLMVRAATEGAAFGDGVEITVRDGATLVAEKKVAVGSDATLSISAPKLWDPNHPFLYTLNVVLLHGGVSVDQVRSYAAMRKVSVRKDKDGFDRIQLNNRDFFSLGPLDQGWWPDGLYTPPSEQAMRYDIDRTKAWGFNTIRKHMKVEPASWYTYCDQVGLLVWQDMPSGDGYPKWEPFKYNGGEEVKRSDASEADYRQEWQEIVKSLLPYPCIGVWTPFNESWGQFKTVEIASWTKLLDPSRLVDPASGGNHRACGDLLDVHHYPEPAMSVHDPERANVIGEFGGILLTLPDHLWRTDPKFYWDKHEHQSQQELTGLYVKYINALGPLISKGLAAGIYTQTTDVEVEVNGIMTYDRKVTKINEDAMRAANEKITHWFDVQH